MNKDSALAQPSGAIPSAIKAIIRSFQLTQEEMAEVQTLAAKLKGAFSYAARGA